MEQLATRARVLEADTMHVLIVNRHFEDVAGGSENQCHQIASELTRLGHEVTYAVCRPRHTTYAAAYQIYPLLGPIPKSLQSALEEVRPDVIYWRYNKRTLLRCVCIARRKRIPFVFAVSHIYDMRIFATKRTSVVGLGVGRRVVRVARYVWEVILTAVNALGVRLVDGFVFQHSGQIPIRLRSRYAVIHNSYPQVDVPARENDTPYVLWISNIKKSKNPEIFIKLAEDLGDSGVEFWMVGGIQDLAYEDVLDSAKLPDKLRYLGHQSQTSVDSLIRGAMFVVHTCSEEGFPNVFLQAWLQKRPVVSFSFDPGDLLSTNRIGICSGDYDSFKRDVQRLIADSSFREELGLRAFDFSVANCNRRKNVKRLAEFLAQILRG